MIDFIPRPYKLSNRIQHYDWGTKDRNAFIPSLLGIPVEPGEPYAELWIGAHPKAPSEIQIGDRLVPLNEIISQYSVESLGEHVAKKFSGRLPFLLKVLSAARALSIQLHPDKNQAERLHKVDPANYPDDNHKPEIAICLDFLNAIVGFKPASKIADSLRSLPELAEFAEKRLVDRVLDSYREVELEKAIRDLYSVIMRRSREVNELSSCISKIHGRLSGKKSLTIAETQFVRQFEVYGADVGLLSFFFFNMVNLKPGQAIFTDAGVPHAYIEGNIVECMANSDNVVRAGLTGKFKDVDTLLDIMRFEFGECPIMNSGQKIDEVVYRTRAEEFRLTRFHKQAGFKKIFHSGNKPSVCLITGGEIELVWSQGGTDHLQGFAKGEAFFVPAFLPEYRISTSEEADFFVVDIP